MSRNCMELFYGNAISCIPCLGSVQISPLFVFTFYHLFNLIKTKHSPNNQQKVMRNLQTLHHAVGGGGYLVCHIYICICMFLKHFSRNKRNAFTFSTVCENLFYASYLCMYGCVCNFAHFHKNEIFSQNEMNDFWFIVCMTFWNKWKWKWIRCVSVCVYVCFV